jgi:hypothetical protein
MVPWSWDLEALSPVLRERKPEMRSPTRFARARLRRAAAAAFLVAGSVIILATMSLAGTAAADPKGNNGTVKIDGVALQDGQANEPHVACQFAVEFYGYDKGDLKASVTFELQSPTKRASGSQVLLTDTLPIGGDPAGGGTDLDASKLYTLDFTGVTPHATQGYHVKVTIHADGSRGADTKHKVFWVQPCVTTTTTTTTAPPTTTTTTAATTTTSTSTPTTPTTVTTAAVLPQQQTTTTTAPTAVLGEQITRPETTLPRTGSGASRLGLIGGSALLLGGLALLLSRPGRTAWTS